MQVELEQLRAAYASKDDEASKVRSCALYLQHISALILHFISGPLTGCKTGRLKICVLGLSTPYSFHADSESFCGPAQDEQA